MQQLAWVKDVDLSSSLAREGSGSTDHVTEKGDQSEFKNDGHVIKMPQLTNQHNLIKLMRLPTHLQVLIPCDGLATVKKVRSVFFFFYFCSVINKICY